MEQVKELTLAKSDNNVRAYLTKMQEKRNEINALHKDNVKFDDQRWITLTFEQLVNTRCSDFLQVKVFATKCPNEYYFPWYTT